MGSRKLWAFEFQQIKRGLDISLLFFSKRVDPVLKFGSEGDFPHY